MRRTPCIIAAALLWAHAVHAGDVFFSHIASGLVNDDGRTSVFVVRDAEHWAAVWRERHDRRSIASAVPEVDFDHSAVIGFYAGRRGDLDHSVRITNIIEGASKITLHIEENVPGHGCLVSPMASTPYTFVLVPAGLRSKPIDFVLTVMSVSCGSSPNKTTEPTR